MCVCMCVCVCVCVCCSKRYLQSYHEKIISTFYLNLSFSLCFFFFFAFFKKKKSP